jgi:hypothetical protein
MFTANLTTDKQISAPNRQEMFHDTSHSSQHHVACDLSDSDLSSWVMMT